MDKPSLVAKYSVHGEVVTVDRVLWETTMSALHTKDAVIRELERKLALTEHPYPEREYPPLSKEHREALALAAQRQHIASLDAERCATPDEEGRAA